MSNYIYITLRDAPQLMQKSAEWFNAKWGVPTSAYIQCMQAYLCGKTELGWYLCLCDGQIVGGLGVSEYDFHNRKDLAPNICAAYTESDHRGRGIAGNLLNMAVEDLRQKGITPVYLVTDHTSFYERYGWEFLCMVDSSDGTSRLYVHK
jgi:GNAT superfamily N-acetyltransferase